MSVEILNPFVLQDFNTPLSDNEYGKLYGELFLTQCGKTVLRCCVCRAEHRFYRRFVEHIVEHNAAMDNTQEQVKEEAITMAPEEVSMSDEEPINKDQLLVKGESDHGLPEVSMSDIQLPEEPINEDQLLVKNESFIGLPQESRHLEFEDELLDSVSVAEPQTEEATEESPSSSDSDDEYLIKVKRKTSERRPKTTSSTKASKPPKPRVSCDLCEATFTRAQALKLHRSRHLGDTKCSCEVCGRKFYHKSYLKIHMRNHTGERPFICKCCGKSYLSAGDRNAHERRLEKRRLNIRPHKCTVCEKAFFDTQQLTKHMSTHTQERKYPCPMCNASFLQSKHLAVHKKIHENARSYVCGICGKGFNQSSARYLHMKNKHKVVGSSAGGFKKGSTAGNE